MNKTTTALKLVSKKYLFILLNKKQTQIFGLASTAKFVIWCFVLMCILCLWSFKCNNYDAFHLLSVFIHLPTLSFYIVENKTIQNRLNEDTSFSTDFHRISKYFLPMVKWSIEHALGFERWFEFLFVFHNTNSVRQCD